MKKKKNFRRMRKQLETKRHSRNLIKRNNYLGCPPRKILGPFLKLTREELKQMDQWTRKLMIMHKALHPRYDIDSLYVSRKERRRGLTSIQDNVDASIQRLEDYLKSAEEDWLQLQETVQKTQASIEQK